MWSSTLFSFQTFIILSLIYEISLQRKKDRHSESSLPFNGSIKANGAVLFQPSRLQELGSG